MTSWFQAWLLRLSVLENLVLEVQIWAVDDQILVIMKYPTVILNMTKKKKQPQAPPTTTADKTTNY